MRRIFTILICLISLALSAQVQQPAKVNKLNIRGTVYENETLDPLEGASVRLNNAEGKLVAGNMTRKNGQFVLPDVPTGNYTLQISFMGFKTQSFSLKLPNRSGNFKINDVMMREDAQMLAEATVVGKLPEMTVVDDTVMYNADAFKLTDGALVEELIEKLPGIVKDDNGNYTWNGKTIGQILVDGKEFFGNNRDIVLKNLPAEIIDKVKAYDKKSDMARITGIDDGNEQTVLDLSIKKDRKKGWFGNIEGAYGTEDRYQGRLMVNRFLNDQKFSFVSNANNTQGNGMSDNQTVGATMNWQKEKIELNGSADGGFSQSSNQSWRNSQSFENKSAAYSNSWNSSSNHNNRFNTSFRIEWRPDSTWNILMRPNFSISGSNSRSGSESAAFNDDPYLFSEDPLADYAWLADTIGVNHRVGANRNTNDNMNLGGSIQVNKRLAKPGRNVTANFNGSYSRSTSESQSYSQVDYYQILAVTGEDSVYHKVQYNDAPSKNRNFSARISYSEPIATQIYLQMSYQYSYRFNDRDRNVSSIFDWMDDGTTPFIDYGIDRSNYRNWASLSQLDIDQCNYTTNSYQNHDIRLQLRINRTKYQLTIGGNLQPQINSVDYTKGQKHYDVTQKVVNASPTLNFRYMFSRQEQLDIRWNGSTGQPGITDLIPDTISNDDPLNIRLGNPSLKPSFTQNIQFNYRRSVPDVQRSSALNLQFRSTQNSTTNRTEYNEVTGGRISKPVNINGNWNGSVSYNFNTALGEKQNWRINTNTQGSITNAVGYVYQSKTQETVKNRTRGMNVRENMRLTYRRDWESGWNLEASGTGSVRYNHSRSTNTSASNLDTYTFTYGVNGTLQFPWGMNFSTNISEQSRRGYSDESMNTNQLIWNATLSQRFLKQKNLTVSIRAIDILNKRDDVNRNVSATSRTDSRSQMVNSYVILSVNYRFGKFGGRNFNRDRNREQRVDSGERPEGGRGGARGGNGGGGRGGNGGGNGGGFGGGFGGGGGRM